MRYEVKSIGIWAFLKIAFFLNLLMGFIGGLFFAMFLAFEFAVMNNMGIEPMPGMSAEDMPTGVLLVILPILFAVGGAVFYTLLGLIFVFIYNLVAKVTGGFEMELRAVEPSPPVSPYAPPGAVAYQQPAFPPPPPPPAAAPPPPPTEYTPPPAVEQPPSEGEEPHPPAGDEPRPL